MIGEHLVDIMEREGLVIDEGDRQNIINDINECILNNHFHFITRNDDLIGWFTAHEITKNGNKHLYITNCIVYRGFRDKNNLLYLRNHIRGIYKNVYRYYFHSNKRDRYVYKH